MAQKNNPENGSYSRLFDVQSNWFSAYFCLGDGWHWCGSQTKFTCFPVNDAERTTKLLVKRRAKPCCECKSIFGFSETFINQIEMHFIGCIWIFRIGSIVLKSSTVFTSSCCTKSPQSWNKRKRQKENRNRMTREIQYIDIEKSQKERPVSACNAESTILFYIIEYTIYFMVNFRHYTSTHVRPSIHSAFPFALDRSA